MGSAKIKAATLVFAPFRCWKLCSARVLQHHSAAAIWGEDHSPPKPSFKAGCTGPQVPFLQLPTLPAVLQVCHFAKSI